MSFFDKIKAGLKKTKESTAANINAVFATFRTVDEDLLSDLEDALILADIGAYVASDAIEELRKQSKLQNLQTKEAVIDCLAKILAEKMAPNNGLQLDTKPSVILMVGVNGVGKTTSIGKIGAKLSIQGPRHLFFRLYTHFACLKTVHTFRINVPVNKGRHNTVKLNRVLRHLN